ncbi:MAG: nucleotidyltransferase domain-containing protein [Candidatus Atribacteria bacterium]|nr:MAG: nucleotidyltransferase domain-containing protein [Candidatus Atribacteria bacterium]
MVSEAPSGLICAEIPNASLFEEALDLCARRSGLPTDAVLRLLDDGDREMHSSFRYGLAKGLCRYLAGLGTGFREMYVYGSSIGESANPTSDIDVIIIVEKKRDEVMNLLRSLDLSLTTHYRRLVGLKKTPASLLDIHVIERGRQDERTGPGAMFDGLHTRPICLWRSDPGSKGASLRGSPLQ